MFALGQFELCICLTTAAIREILPLAHGKKPETSPSPPPKRTFTPKMRLQNWGVFPTTPRRCGKGRACFSKAAFTAAAVRVQRRRTVPFKIEQRDPQLTERSTFLQYPGVDGTPVTDAARSPPPQRQAPRDGSLAPRSAGGRGTRGPEGKGCGGCVWGVCGVWGWGVCRTYLVPCLQN